MMRCVCFSGMLWSFVTNLQDDSKDSSMLVVLTSKTAFRVLWVSLSWVFRGLVWKLKDWNGDSLKNGRVADGCFKSFFHHVNLKWFKVNVKHPRCNQAQLRHAWHDPARSSRRLFAIEICHARWCARVHMQRLHWAPLQRLQLRLTAPCCEMAHRFTTRRRQRTRTLHLRATRWIFGRVDSSASSAISWTSSADGPWFEKAAN